VAFRHGKLNMDVSQCSLDRGSTFRAHQLDKNFTNGYLPENYADRAFIYARAGPLRRIDLSRSCSNGVRRKVGAGAGRRQEPC
jgi:hypothetical protein